MTPHDAAAVAIPARSHYHSLRGAGWSLRSIAAHAGVGTADLYRYLDGAHLPHVERGLLAIEPNTLATVTNNPAAEPFVPRVGTVRRLRALMRMGWPAHQINARLHDRGIVDKRAAENLLNSSGRWVTRSRHDAVAAVYRELSTTSGPSERTRRRAEKNGYPGPMDWDDIDHDEAPEKSEELCVLDGCLATAQWVYDGDYSETRVLCSRHTKAGAA